MSRRRECRQCRGSASGGRLELTVAGLVEVVPDGLGCWVVDPERSFSAGSSITGRSCQTWYGARLPPDEFPQLNRPTTSVVMEMVPAQVAVTVSQNNAFDRPVSSTPTDRVDASFVDAGCSD
jgi:hypothetical protein